MPIILLTLSLALGTLIAGWLGTSYFILLCPFPLLALVFQLLGRRRIDTRLEMAFQISIGLSMFFFGGMLYHFAMVRPGNHVIGLQGQTWQVEGIALESSKTTQYGKKVILECEQLSGTDAEVAGKVMVYLNENEPDLRQGERVRMELKFQELKSRYPGYLKYLHQKGIIVAGRGQQIESLGMTGGAMVRLGSFREILKQRLLSTMPDQRIAGLAVAMLLGDKSMLTADFRDSFGASGLSHILAISGLHVSIIFLFLKRIFGLLAFFGGRHQNRIATLAALSVLVLFMFMTGAAPSVCRATMMIGLLELGKMLYSKTKSAYTLALAGLLQILWHPPVIFEVGFQLSFAAVAGILLVAPRMQDWIEHNWQRGRDPLLASACVCLGAQVFTAPLVWIHFGSFPTYFLFANLLVLPLVNFTVNLGFATLALAWIPGVGSVVAGMLDFCLWVISAISDVFANWPGAKIETIGLQDAGFCILLAMVIGGTLIWGMTHRIRVVRKATNGLAPIPIGA